MTVKNMDKATRLFDCLTVQAKEPTAGLLNSKVEGSWNPYSTGEVHEMVYQLAQSLLDIGVSAGNGTVEGRDKIGLISAGRPEWLIVDLAVQLTGAVLVPLYPNTSIREIEQILNEAGVKCIFVSNKELYDKISLVHINVPSLKTVFTFDTVNGSTNWIELLKPLLPGYQQRLSEISDKITEADVATIIYTSGTTGRPKGVMLTHKNIL